MTKEEALDILHHNWTRVDNPNYDESELDEAINMCMAIITGALLYQHRKGKENGKD